MKKTLGTLLGVIALLLTVAAPAALAVQIQDGGVDEASTGSEMNKPSYWEDRFGIETRTVTCTKYEGHDGHIPAKYDAAVIKDGSEVVRVYADLTESGAFNAVGAINPSNGQRYGSPHSWVMKCEFEDVEQPDPDPELQLTSICLETNGGGERLLYISGSEGFATITVPDDVDVFRVTNTGTVETTYTSSKAGFAFLGDGDGTVAPGETEFFAVTNDGGSGTTIINYGDDLSETKAATNTPCEAPEVPDELQLTSICVATNAASYELYVSSEAGFVTLDVPANSNVFRVKGVVGTDVEYDIALGGPATFLGDADGVISEGETEFFAVPAAQPGTVKITYSDGDQTKAASETPCDFTPLERERTETTEWVDGTYECNDTTVTQTRTVTVINETSTDGGETWDIVSQESTTEEQTRELTDEEFEFCPEFRERVVESEWVDGEFECDDTTVTQTRTVTTISEVSYDGGETWEPAGASSIVREERTRDLTDEEQFDCPIEPKASLIPICSADGMTATLDMLVETEGRYSLTLDGTTIREFDGPGSFTVPDLPLVGNVSLYFDGTAEPTLVAGGEYDLSNCAPDVEPEPTPVEPEPTPVTLEPSGELPNTGSDLLPALATALLALMAGATMVLRSRKQ